MNHKQSINVIVTDIGDCFSTLESIEVLNKILKDLEAEHPNGRIRLTLRKKEDEEE